ncbi:hypothetical protein [Aliiruegeria sabulilitoris]|uniref:hypothetical protein n=1 Tax=Aliiruegeria sabulilitoris TaxID=1510458 RepID=UPI00083167C6|nr:hypothetical protein [Aliiruegeria sabulilitoris]NDR57855.1 hypothetical protein [Pseudoruegeria sp. M32A2M]
MTRVARIFSACLIAAFFLGLVTQSASAGMMDLSMDMAVSQNAEMNHAPCVGCDDDGMDGQSDCDGACGMAEMVALPVGWTGPNAAASGEFSDLAPRFRNRDDPPARTPPRAIS